MKIGYALTGSFCTVSRSLDILKRLSSVYEVVPIISDSIAKTDTRFGKASDTVKTLTDFL